MGKYASVLLRTILFSIIMMLSGPLHAQISAKAPYNRHALSVETLGKGGLYSLNYDYLASYRSALGLGFSYQSIRAHPMISEAQIQLVTLPVYANFYFPIENHRPFLSTAVTFIKAHATANLDLSEVFAGMKLSYASDNNEEQVSVEKADLKMNNSVDVFFAIPSLGAGYEFRTAEGAIFRLQALGFIHDKITAWGGLSFGVAL